MSRLDKLSVPVIQGGMGVGISLGGLAGAVAACGGMGVISTANIGFREPDFFSNTEEADQRALIKEIRKAREIAGGKGLIAINAMAVTTRYADMVRTACREGIDAVISGAGLPLELPSLTKGFDVMIAPIVSSGRAARSLLSIWQKRHQRRADFVVVEGSRAGGHLGFAREELTGGRAKPLAEIVSDVCGVCGGGEGEEPVPVFAAGSVFDRRDMAEVKRAGAYGVQIATRFIACRECDASQAFKDVILSADSEDAMILQSPVGMPGRGLRTPLIERIEAGGRLLPKSCVRCIKTCDPGTTAYCINRALTAAFYGNYEEGLFFCGGNVGRVREMTTAAALMEELSEDWSNA